MLQLYLYLLRNYESLIINGDGSSDFTHIDNIIHINMLALKTDSSEALNQIYNGAGGENISVLEMEKLISKKLAQYDPSILKIEPIFGPYRKGDIKHSLACIEKAGRLLGYKPVCSFTQGLEKTIEWYWKNMK